MPTDATSTHGLHLRAATYADRDAVCRLLAEVGGETSDTPIAHAPPVLADPAAHDWLYWDNPYGEPHNVVWTEGDRIIAHAGLYPGLGVVEGRVLRIGRFAHAVTARGYRGRGLYGALARRQREALGTDLDLLIALPTAAALPALEGAGVMQRDRAQRWFRPIGEDFADLRHVPRPLASTLTRVAFGPPPEADGDVITEVPDDVDDLAQADPPDGVLADADWWRWRFLANPVHTYRLHRTSQGGRTTAMIATRPTTYLGAVFVQVLHWQARDADAAAGVLGAALADHPDALAATLLATDDSTVAEWARRCGMRKLPSLLDETSGHISLAAAPGAGAIVPGRHWNVSLASHHDR